MSNEHEWLPELPSLEEMVDARNKFMLTQPENQQYFIGLHIGKLDFRRNYAKPYRDVCLVLLEALLKRKEFISDKSECRCFPHSSKCGYCCFMDVTDEAITKAKGIFQK